MKISVLVNMPWALPCTRQHVKCFSDINTISSQHNEEGTIMIPILKTGKVRHRELKLFAQDHTAEMLFSLVEARIIWLQNLQH